jgi:signal transduction histidine kinase
VQAVDVHEGLDNTLVILRHKLKNNIHVIREYNRDLPRIEAYAGELNQVWTNIIDNAADALNGQGEIRLRTAMEGQQVVVELSDNGPGIPPEIQSRVFEPFFTTKAPGVGTGLGLNIAYNIVHKHYGEIQLDSRPGRTVFRVKLPTTLPTKG